ncbi:hypothetical protein TB1_022416 [Malus domestica]
MTTAETTEGDEIIFIVDAKRRQFVLVFAGRTRMPIWCGIPNRFLWPEEKELGLDWEEGLAVEEKPEENQTLEGNRISFPFLVVVVVALYGVGRHTYGRSA